MDLKTESCWGISRSKLWKFSGMWNWNIKDISKEMESGKRLCFLEDLGLSSGLHLVETVANKFNLVESKKLVLGIFHRLSPFHHVLQDAAPLGYLLSPGHALLSHVIT